MVGQAEQAEAIVCVGVDPGIVEDQVRQAGECLVHQYLQIRQIGRIARTLGQAHVKIRRRLGPRPVILAMKRGGKDARLVGEDQGRPVAMVHIAINYRDTADRAFLQQAFRGDGDIVEDAEACTAIRPGMMAAAGEIDRCTMFQREACSKAGTADRCTRPQGDGGRDLEADGARGFRVQRLAEDGADIARRVGQLEPAFRRMDRREESVAVCPQHFGDQRVFPHWEAMAVCHGMGVIIRMMDEQRHDVSGSGLKARVQSYINCIKEIHAAPSHGFRSPPYRLEYNTCRWSLTMIDIRRFENLGRFRNAWLNANYHFSFSGYHDPRRMGEGALRVWNDDTIAPHTGFPAHGHQSMEIITYVRNGAITHEDSMGNHGRTEAGDVQVMSAGTGVQHAEWNEEDEATSLFQIWIQPRSPGGKPGWGSRKFPKGGRSGNWVVLASGDGVNDSLVINQDAQVLGATLKTGERLAYEVKAGRHGYLVLAAGSVRLNGEVLNARDGAAATGAESLMLEGIEDAEIVFVDTV